MENHDQSELFYFYLYDLSSSTNQIHNKKLSQQSPSEIGRLRLRLYHIWLQKKQKKTNKKQKSNSFTNNTFYHLSWYGNLKCPSRIMICCNRKDARKLEVNLLRHINQFNLFFPSFFFLYWFLYFFYYSYWSFSRELAFQVIHKFDN